MQIIIKQNDCLTEHEYHDLLNLATQCTEQDGVASKVHWDLLRRKREISGNFLCYFQDDSQEKLIGYLSFFMFDEDAAHISAMVHPSNRRQHVFSHLLHAARVEMLKLGVNKMKCSFPIQNEMTRYCMASLAGQFLCFEYVMERLSRLPEHIENNLLSIRKARDNDIEDVELMANMDVICFKSDYATMVHRFKETALDPKRQAWLAYLGEDCIGKAHIDCNQEKAYIHDVGVLPAWQNKGYGTLLLKFIINHLIMHDHCHQMYLEVAAGNESALQLYKKCGFEMANCYEYWCVRLY